MRPTAIVLRQRVSDSDYTNQAIRTLYETGTVRDIDGNTYQTIRSGDQWWMAENLRVSKYRDGTPILFATDSADNEVMRNDMYWIYNNNESGEMDTYGALYNWYAVVDSRNVAPEGWHVPEASEWQVLVDNLGGEVVAGSYMKQTGTILWEDNAGATNQSGFTALPGGIYEHSGSWGDEPSCRGLGYSAYFWSATAVEDSIYGGAWCCRLYSRSSEVSRDGHSEWGGLSVRCVKDSP